MSLQTFNSPILIAPLPQGPTNLNTANGTIDAAGESQGYIGHVYLSTGPGTSKTISSGGGGKIWWRAGAITFANGSTSLDIGIQDVGATGLEDGSFDVKATLVGGTDTINANVLNGTTMETGTKTITHGDQIAVVIEMTAKGGADSVVVVRNNISATMPYCTADTGAGPAKVANMPFITIQFDDGTMGHLGHNSWAAVTETVGVFGSSSVTDELCLFFTLPFKAQAVGLYAQLSSLAATDDFEMILYSDPNGTPVAERTISQDGDLNGLSQMFDRPFTSAYTLEANTRYCVALRPTTTNTISMFRITFGTGNGVLRGATMLGTNWSSGGRANQTGDFDTLENDTLLPLFGVWVNALDDGVGNSIYVPQNTGYTGIGVS
jgi:hypothetical protein